MLRVLATVLSSLLGVLLFLVFLTRVNQWLKMRSNKTKVIGFFHPNCDAGAGGEKVLWSAVAAVQRDRALSKNLIHIYSGSTLTPAQILNEKVLIRFGIKISPENLEFIQIDKESHTSLDPEQYPSFTMIW